MQIKDKSDKVQEELKWARQQVHKKEVK